MASAALIGGRADTMMDSDAGGFTTDDRAATQRMLDAAERYSSESEDDDIGEGDFYPPPAARAHDPPPQRARPAPPSTPPPRPAVPAPAVIRPALRAAAPPTPIPGRSESPVNDEDEHDAAPPPAPAPARAPAARARTDDTFTIPATPHEALLRYDASMNYLVEILSHLTGDNTNAVTAKASLEIFRRQMLAWHGNVDQGDWEKATKSMLMYSETVRMVIHTTVQRVKDQRGAARPRAPARPDAADHAKVVRAIPTATPTDTESAPPRPVAPMALHLNPARPESSRAEPARREPAHAVPEYVARAEDEPDHRRGGEGCGIM